MAIFCWKSVLAVLSTFFLFATARDSITPTKPLVDNEFLVSTGGTFALGFFTPNNSTNHYYIGLWNRNMSVQNILWVANRVNPVVGSPGQLSVTDNGTISITDRNLTLVWSAGGTYELVNPVVQLLDTGNFVLREEGDYSQNYAWQGFGDAVHVSNGSIDLPSKPHKRNIVAIVVTRSLMALLATLLLSCAIYFFWRRKNQAREEVNFFRDELNEDDNEADMDLPLFNFSTIAVATESFSSENKLGQGGFGHVYKGKLDGDKYIAVKRLDKSSQQGTEEFKNEVILIAKLQNRNLVRLLGCCIQGEERMLVYEYMPNKSLDAFLFDKEKATLLDWQKRYQIIVGITRGLLYLHHDSRFRIIHRDLKASNILLDEDMNPKISDFGMARLFGGGETDFNTRKVVGTYGYMSPEYAMEGTFSMKSDVFSFGVILLEIISGKKNRGSYAYSSHLNLVAHAWSLWKENKSLELVDESMDTNFPANVVIRCIKIGLLCVQENPEDRPLMSHVIEMLGADLMSLLEPKQPGFIARMSPFELDHAQGCQSSCMSNELTVTLDGR